MLSKSTDRHQRGLNTINLSELNTWQQCMLFFLIMMGSAILVSALVVHIRKRAFEKKFDSIFQQGKSQSRRSRKSLQVHGDHEGMVEMPELEAGHALNTTGNLTRDGRHMDTKDTASAVIDDDFDSEDDQQQQADHITFSPSTRFASSHDLRRRRGSIFSANGVGARPGASLPASNFRPPSSARNDLADYGPSNLDEGFARGLTSRYFPSAEHISRNSRFHGLSDAEREELGGVEYKAICFLAWVVPLYYILFQLLGCLGLAAYVARNRAETATSNGLNPWWVGAFNGVSAFNNSGMSLLDANMTAFQTSYYVCLTMGLLILAGNTC